MSYLIVNDGRLIVNGGLLLLSPPNGEETIKHPDGTAAGTPKKTNGQAGGTIKRKVGGSWQ